MSLLQQAEQQAQDRADAARFRVEVQARLLGLEEAVLALEETVRLLVLLVRARDSEEED
jgi:hypothetical protein